eukprot:TRINITY_DN791_c2_g1_i2.p1 TRINITY_DN791_c2_g1~~TRINITY_DN791_c2_g1_i2.p1  ORF type:complete len:1179 (+),score=350.01 TRINITY_DN791_c2_g1_i2:145-3537(+)
MEPFQQYVQLVKLFISPDNATRNQAEKQFTEWKDSQTDLVIRLELQGLSAEGPENIQVRQTSALLLKQSAYKCISRKSVGKHDAVTQETVELVKQELLNRLGVETSKNVRGLICAAIGVLCTVLSLPVATKAQNFTWPALVPTVHQMIQDPNPDHKTTGLTLLDSIQEPLASVLVNEYEGFSVLVFNTLQDQALPLAVRAAAAETACTLIRTMLGHSAQQLQQAEAEASGRSSKRKQAKQLHHRKLEVSQNQFSVIMQCLIDCIQTQDAAVSNDLFRALIDLADTQPKVFRKHVSAVSQAMLNVTTVENFDENIRMYAMELLKTLVQKLSTVFRRMGTDFAKAILQVLIGWLLTVEDESDWPNKREEDDQNDEDQSLLSVAWNALDSVSLSLGGSHLVPVAWELLAPFLKDGDWRKRYAALTTIGLIAEGCCKQFKPHLSDLFGHVCPMVQDPHHRVRHAAINTLGQICNDFAPDVERNFHALIVPTLVQALSREDEVARVRAHAAVASVNFTEHCDENTLQPYLHQLLGSLYTSMCGQSKYVQEESITAIASIAQVSGGIFTQYYDNFMPLLRQIVLQATSQADKRLRGKAIECASFIGVAVGAQKFTDDANAIMQSCATYQPDDTDDDILVRYFFEAYARIVAVIGDQFLPYLDAVLPPVIKMASKNIAWTAIDGGYLEMADSPETIREICLALYLLEACISALGDKYLKYIEPTIKALTSALQTPLVAEIRCAAAAVAPNLLQAIKKYGESHPAEADATRQKLLSIWLTFREPLLVAIYEEAENLTSEEAENPEHIGIILDVWTLCVQAVGKDVEKPDQLEKDAILIAAMFKSVQHLREGYLDRLEDDDVDEEERAQLLEEAEEHQGHLNRFAAITGAYIETHAAFQPYLEQYILPAVLNTLLNSELPSDVHVAICIFDDTIEHWGEKSHQYWEVAVPAMFQAMKHEEEYVQQAAVFGVGHLAVCSGQTFGQHWPQILEFFISKITAENARVGDQQDVTDNMICAMARICIHQSQFVDSTRYLPMWLSYLPTYGDVGEASVIQGLLCDILMDPTFGPMLLKPEHIGHILYVFAEGLYTPHTNETATKKIQQTLAFLSQHVPSDVMQGAFGQLSEAHRDKLQRASSGQ